MNTKKDVEIRLFASRKAYKVLDFGDEHRIVEVIRTRVLPAAKAEYYRVDVKIKRKADQTPKYLVAYLLRKDVYLAEVVRVDVESDFHVTDIAWDYDESKDEEDEEDDASMSKGGGACDLDFVAATPVPDIPTARAAAEFLHNLFTTLGFKSKLLLGVDASVANYQMYLSCGLKGFVNIGHGNANEIVVDDGTLSAAWFNSVANQSLKPAVVYFNSCQVHNDPLKSAVMRAGARTFIGGIVNLLIGPSEEVCKCFWGKILPAAIPMGDALHTCEKEKYPEEGAHGITGDTGPFNVTSTAKQGSFTLPPNIKFGVMARTNAYYEQEITILVDGVVEAIFTGIHGLDNEDLGDKVINSGRGNVEVKIKANGKDSEIVSAQVTLAKKLSFGLVGSEDWNDSDYNDAIVILNWPVGA